MKTGNVILVHNPLEWNKPRTYIFWVLRIVTGAFYHHCAGICWIENKCYVVEAKEKGVVKTLFEHWHQAEPKRVFEIINIEANAENILCHLNKKYDGSSFILFCLVKILTKGIWLGKTNDKADNKLYCFELWALIHGLPQWYCILPVEFINAINIKIKKEANAYL